MVRVMAGVPDCGFRSFMPVGSQYVIWLGRHLLVPPDHAPSPAVLPPLPWTEVGGYFRKELHRYHLWKFLLTLYPLWLGGVGIETANQDWVHVIRAVAERCSDVIGIGYASRWGVALKNEPALPTHHNLEAEYTWTKVLVRLYLPMGVITGEDCYPPSSPGACLVPQTWAHCTPTSDMCICHPWPSSQTGPWDTF